MEIINDPKYISLSEYKNQIELYKNRVSNINGVQSIYLMGSIKAPGLSDIDVIVVVDDDFDPNLSHILSVSGLDPRLYLHGPIVVPISLSERFQEIVYASNLECIHGPDTLQKWSDLNSDNRTFLSVCYLIDFIESRYLQSEDINDKFLDKRAWLTRIWSTVHSIFLYENISGKELPDRLIEVKNKILMTRVSWLENNFVTDEDFLDALNSSFKINEFIFEDIVSSFYGKPVLENNFKIRTANKIIKFNNQVNFPSYKKKVFSIAIKKIVIYVIEQRPSYLAHLSGYIKLNINWKTLPIENKQLQSVKKKRSNLVTTHVTWLNEHAPASRSMKGYLGIEVIEDHSIKGYLKKFLTRMVS